MKGLLLRLSAVDSGAEAAVRMIAYFDELVARRASLPDLVRAAASLAECPAGLRYGEQPPRRYLPDGTTEAALVPDGAVVAELSGDVPGQVWLERTGDAGLLDDLVLERFAIAVRLLAPAPPRPAAPCLADPALVELVLGEQAADEDRTPVLLG